MPKRRCRSSPTTSRGAELSPRLGQQDGGGKGHEDCGEAPVEGAVDPGIVAQRPGQPAGGEDDSQHHRQRHHHELYAKEQQLAGGGGVGGGDELRQEGDEEKRHLGIGEVDAETGPVALGEAGSVAARLRHQQAAAVADRLNGEPEQVKRSGDLQDPEGGDRKSTRLNSSHVKISYAVFCLKKKNDAYHIDAAPPPTGGATAD